MPFTKKVTSVDITDEVRAAAGGNAETSDIDVTSSLFTLDVARGGGSGNISSTFTSYGDSSGGTHVYKSKTSRTSMASRAMWVAIAIAAIISTPIDTAADTGSSSEDEEEMGGKRKLRHSTEQQQTTPPFEREPRVKRRKSMRIRQLSLTEKALQPHCAQFRRRIKRGSAKSRTAAKSLARRLARNARADVRWEQAVLGMRASQDGLKEAVQKSDLSIICSGWEELNLRQGLVVMKKAQCFWTLYEVMIRNGRQGTFRQAVEQTCEMTSSFIGVAPRTLRGWWYDYVQADYDVEGDTIGRHKRDFIIDNEDIKERAVKFIRKFAQPKGSRNMTAADFMQFINGTGDFEGEGLFKYMTPEELKEQGGIELPMSVETSRHWLGRLGADFAAHGRSIYFDGHDKEENVADRKTFVATMLELYKHMHLYVQLTPAEAREKIVGDDTTEFTRERARQFIQSHTVTNKEGTAFVEYRCGEERERERERESRSDRDTSDTSDASDASENTHGRKPADHGKPTNLPFLFSLSLSPPVSSLLSALMILTSTIMITSV